MPAKLLVVGGGRIGGALVTGLIDRGWALPEEIAVIEPDPLRATILTRENPGLGVVESLTPALATEAEGAVLAVKPDVAEVACRDLRAAGVGRVLSVAAGIASARLEAALGEAAVVLRAMPNVAVVVGAGVSALAGGTRARAEDLDWAEGILSAVGVVVRLPERHLHAVTGLSGSGPAYVFLVAEALVDAGVLCGLPRDVSRTLVTQTLLGSAKLLATGEPPEALRAEVTSPGGTTAAGLRALEARAVRSAFLEAVSSAAERSRQLGH